MKQIHNASFQSNTFPTTAYLTTSKPTLLLAGIACSQFFFCPDLSTYVHLQNLLPDLQGKWVRQFWWNLEGSSSVLEKIGPRPLRHL